MPLGEMGSQIMIFIFKRKMDSEFRSPSNAGQTAKCFLLNPNCSPPPGPVAPAGILLVALIIFIKVNQSFLESFPARGFGCQNNHAR